MYRGLQHAVTKSYLVLKININVRGNQNAVTCDRINDKQVVVIACVNIRSFHFYYYL